MKSNIYSRDLKFLIRLAKHSYRLIRHNKPVIYSKGKNDMVTNLDLMIEKYMISKINKHYPSFKVVSEEYNSKESLCDNCFIIDPIDGTINFASGLPLWGIQIAYRKDAKTVASVIYIPCLDELYYAIDGIGAYLNGKAIHISDRPDNSIIFEHSVRQEERKQILNDLNSKYPHFRYYHCSAFSFSQIAKGSMNGYILFSNNAWDIEPGHLLCKEAGAHIYRCPGYIIVASSEELLNNIMTSVIKHSG